MKVLNDILVTFQSGATKAGKRMAPDPVKAGESKSEQKSSAWDLGSIVGICITLYFLSAAWHWAWYSKLRYSIQYAIPFGQITCEKEPHDCEFMRAPIGEKNCHFDAEVITTTTTEPNTENPSVRTTLSGSGETMVSFDDGKTWVAKRSLPTKTFVYLSWKKVEE